MSEALLSASRRLATILEQCRDVTVIDAWANDIDEALQAYDAAAADVPRDVGLEPPVPLRPLGTRVLIVPDPQPEMSAGGLHLVSRWQLETTGVVAAVGVGSAPDQALLDVLARCRANAWEDRDLVDALDEVIASSLRVMTPEVEIGERVAFADTAGQEVTIAGVRYLLMEASDLLAVVEA